MSDSNFVLAELKRWIVQQYDLDRFAVIRWADVLVKIADIEAAVTLDDDELIPPKREVRDD